MSLGSVRAIVTTLDQCVSSASNFAVGVVVARVAGVDGLGGFALAYTAWLLIAALHRALVTDPMAITGDGRRSRSRGHEIEEGLAAEITLGAIAAAGVGALGLVLVLVGQTSFGLPQLMLAPWIPALLAQDYWRWIGFMQANPKASLANDLVFDLVQALAFGALLASRAHSALLAMAAWGFSGLVGAAFGLWQFKVRPRVRGGLRSLGRKGKVGGWIGAGAVAGWGVAQIYSVITAVTLGPAGLGGLRAAQNLVAGPSFVLIQAGGSVGLPEATRAYEESGWMGLKRVSRIVTGAGVASVGFVLIGTMLVGRDLLRIVYGPAFGRFQPVAIIFALTYTICAISLGDILELKATKRTRPLFNVQVVALVVSALAVGALSVEFGVAGAAIGFGLGTTILTVGQVRAGRSVEPCSVAVDAVGALQEDRSRPPVLIAALDLTPGAAAVEHHTARVQAYLESHRSEVEVVTPLSNLPRLASASLAVGRRLAAIAPTSAARWSWVSQYFLLRASLASRLTRPESALVYAQCPLAARAALSAAGDRSHKVVLAVYSMGWQTGQPVSPTAINSRGLDLLRAGGRDMDVILEVDGRVFVGAPLTMHPSNLTGPSDLVTVGSLEANDNDTYLLEVLAQAAMIGRRYTLDFIGTGLLRQRMARRAAVLGVADQVRFLPLKSDLWPLLVGHKAYVHASYRDGWPLALVAAMSAGLPSFAPAVGMIPEILSDGACGVLWPLDDPYLAAWQLVRALDDSERLAQMAEASKQRYMGTFTDMDPGPQVANFFRSVLGREVIAVVPAEASGRARGAAEGVPVDAAVSRRGGVSS